MRIQQSQRRKNRLTIGVNLLLAGILFTSALVFYYINVINPARATSGFSAGNIISNNKMSEVNAMSEAQIRTFIQQRNANCSSSNTLCFRNYTENGKDAARIIYEASQAHRINPQVILVTIQKEQGLVTHTNPAQWMYNSAMGYNCPDSTPGRCGTDEKGFLRQVIWGTTMYRAILDGGGSWSNQYASGTRWITPYIVGVNTIQRNPKTSCGSSQVVIENRATQALYNYTPYRPDSAALNAGYGLGGDCSSYGNRNFFLYMRDWFGYIASASAYSWSSVSQKVFSDEARTQLLPYNTTLQPGQGVYIEVKAKNTGDITWFNSNTYFATERNKDRKSVFQSSSWISSDRTARLVEAQVTPGAIGTFRFTLKAPSKLGNYNEYFNIVLEGQSWLNDIGFYLPLQVVNSREIQLYRNAERTQLISDNKVNINEPVYVRLKYTNYSLLTWPASTRIATTSPDDRASTLRHNSWISSDRVINLGREVKHGETGTVDFILQAKSNITTVNEKFGLVIDGDRWIDRDSINIQYTTREKPLDTLTVDETKMVNTYLSSSSEKYRYILQDDGNLVLYSSSRAIWSTGTVGSGANRLVLQDDGNLVLYSSSRAIWSTGTVGSGANRLVLQDDGNLVLYSSSRAIWSTGTMGR